MTRRLKHLNRALGLSCAPPPFELDTKQVCRRVHHVLVTEQRERKLYMKQKIKFAAVLVAVVVALTGTTLAVAQTIDVLTAWFEGDTSAAEALVDRTPRSISDESYTLSVGSSVSDESDIYLVLKIEAKTPQATTYLMGNDFSFLQSVHIEPIWSDPAKAPSTPTPAPAGNGGFTITTPDGGSIVVGENPNPNYKPSVGLTDMSAMGLDDACTDTTLAWRIVGKLPDGATSLRIWLDDMGEEQSLEVPINPAETLTLSPSATGIGAGWFDNTERGTVTLTQVRLTPFSAQFLFTHPPEQPAVYPPVLLRLSDGKLYTINQLATRNTGGTPVLADDTIREGFLDFRCRSVMDLAQIKGVVVFDREYPMNGGASVSVEVDPKLLPFSLPSSIDSDGSGGLSVRALCDALGASCQWDNASQSATLIYRDTTVVLTLNSDTALVNGEQSPLFIRPFAHEGKLFVQDRLLSDAFKISVTAAYQSPEYTEPIAWNIAP